MDLFAGSWAGSIAAVVGVWGLAVVVLSLIECKGDLAEFRDAWQFVLLKRPWLSVREGLDRLRGELPKSEKRRDERAEARQLSDVLQIPIVDAELSLELSNAFFQPTADQKLNGEAVELLFAASHRNETWRARAGECCQKLRALKR